METKSANRILGEDLLGNGGEDFRGLGKFNMLSVGRSIGDTEEVKGNAVLGQEEGRGCACC